MENFDKSQLMDLDYSLTKELKQTNSKGSYFGTSIIGCNSSRQHGLMVCSFNEDDTERHVLLSCIDETLEQSGFEYDLGIHQYAGGTTAESLWYIKDCSNNPIPCITYSAGPLVLTKEILFAERKNSLFIRYTLKEANAKTTLHLKPLLAFRNVNTLSRFNTLLNTRYHKIDGGISTKLYSNYPDLNMQVSKEAEFVYQPHWQHNVEYVNDIQGKDNREDLYVPGHFKIDLEPGESIVFAASLKVLTPQVLNGQFLIELNKLIAPKVNSKKLSARPSEKRLAKTKVFA